MDLFIHLKQLKIHQAPPFAILARVMAQPSMSAKSNAFASITNMQSGEAGGSIRTAQVGTSGAGQ